MSIADSERRSIFLLQAIENCYKKGLEVVGNCEGVANGYAEVVDGLGSVLGRRGILVCHPPASRVIAHHVRGVVNACDQLCGIWRHTLSKRLAPSIELKVWLSRSRKISL